MRIFTELTKVLPIVAILHPLGATAQTPDPPTRPTVPPADAARPAPLDRPLIGATEAAKTFGKWQVTCPPREPCRLAQSIVGDTSKRPVLVARAYRASPDPVLLLTFPLGVFLAPGVAFAFDAGKPDRVPFETCDPSGCHLGIKLAPTVFAKLRKAREVAVTAYDGEQKATTMRLDLEGFVAAYAELSK